jgi:hypothetical protein
MITFASYFTMGKAPGGEHSQNAGLDWLYLHYRLVRHAFMIVSRSLFVCLFVCGVFEYSQLHKVPFA